MTTVRNSKTTHPRRYFLAATATTLILSLAAPQARARADFQGLGDLDGGTFSSEAWSVSDDGSVVVGDSSGASGWEAFRWTQAGGIVDHRFIQHFTLTASMHASSAGEDPSNSGGVVLKMGL